MYTLTKIADQLNRCGKNPVRIVVNPTEILHGVYTKVKKLADKKAPLLHLKIIKDKWNT